MNDQSKTSEALLKELQYAKKEIEALKSELSHYKNHFELVMMAASFAWWEMDVPTGNVKYSPHKTEMLGYLSENFKHYKDFMALVHPNDYDKTMQEMMNHFQGKSDTYDAYYRIQTSTGEYKLFHDIGRITKRDSNNRPITVSGIVIDVVDKSKLDEVQRESEARFRYMFQDNKSVMLLVEPETGKIVDANKTAANFYKYSIEELRGMNIERINTLDHETIISEKAKAVNAQQNSFFSPTALLMVRSDR
jgi:PAS domain S-box-containing protein